MLLCYGSSHKCGMPRINAYGVQSLYLICNKTLWKLNKSGRWSRKLTQKWVGSSLFYYIAAERIGIQFGLISRTQLVQLQPLLMHTYLVIVCLLLIIFCYGDLKRLVGVVTYMLSGTRHSITIFFAGII